MIIAAVLHLAACSRPEKGDNADSPETLSRTEFTDRIENFFEYEPLKPGKESQFLIHLTDLSDGSPVEQAEVTLSISSPNEGALVASANARVGKVAGIYVADVVVPRPGGFNIEFHIKNSKLDERMLLTDFRVE
jgi:hypothetical protein